MSTLNQSQTKATNRKKANQAVVSILLRLRLHSIDTPRRSTKEMKDYQVRYYDTVMSVAFSEADLILEIKKNNLDKERHVIPKSSLSSEFGSYEEKDRGYIHNIRTVFKFGIILSIVAVPSGLLMGGGFPFVEMAILAGSILGHIFTPSISPKREAITLYSRNGAPQARIPGKHKKEGKEEFSTFTSELRQWLGADEVEPGGSINSVRSAHSVDTP